MKKYLSILLTLFRDLLKPLLSFYLLILLLKSLNLYDGIVALLKSLFPLFYGILLAFFLQPLVDKLKKYMKNKYAVYVVYGGSVIIVLVVITFFVPFFMNELSSMSHTIAVLIEKILIFIQYHQLDLLVSDEMMKKIMQTTTDFSLNMIKDLFAVLVKILFSFAIAFFISQDFEYGINLFKKYVVNHSKWLNFYHTFSNVILKYLLGTILDLIFIFITASSILFYFHFENALFYGGILALLNLFPYIGATLGVALIALVGFLHFETFPFFCILVIWILQQIEANLIQPLIFNKTMDVHPLFLFTALFVGETLFGVTGLILSPIIGAFMQIAQRSYFHILNHQSVGGWEDIFW